MTALTPIYEDANFVGFEKPAGLPTTYGASEDCLAARVKVLRPDLFEFAGFNENEGGLLYRLDNETSGLVLFAKNREAFDRFQSDENLEKIYEAGVENWELLPDAGVIDYPIAHKSALSMVAVVPGKKLDYRGKAVTAETRFEKAGKDRVRCFIKKGMRHQIRVHLASIGHAIFGDPLYNKFSRGSLALRCVGVKSDWLNVTLGA